jgi:DNA-binding NarL/FixJ family response regulator
VGPLAYAAALERVRRHCAPPVDARMLRLQLLEEIRRIVPFDAYAWLLTDPEACVGSTPLADVPCLPELPRLIRLKYLTELNRWTGLESPVALLAHATAGKLSESLLWRELLQSYEVVDVASVVFRDEFGCWGFLDLWRAADAEPFSPAAAGWLADIAPAVTTALRASQANAFVDPVADARTRRGPVVLVLSRDLEVLAQTADTEAYLRLLVPPDSAHAPIPAHAYNVGAQLLALEAGVDTHAAAVRVSVSPGRWLTLRAARMEDGRPPQDRDIAVTIEDSSPLERAALFAASHGLTSRESEILGHVVAGLDTRGLATVMNLSQHTVQDHLKAVFAKGGVHSRRELRARVVGT